MTTIEHKMSPEERRVFEIIEAKKAIYGEDPCDIIIDQLIKINSAKKYNSKTGRFESISGDDGFIRPMILTETQSLLDGYCKRQHRQRKAVSVYFLKARREGASTYIQSRAISKACVKDGYKVLVVAHKQKTAEEIYSIGNQMLKNFPPWFGVPGELRRDSKEYMEVMASAFGTTTSSMRCLWTSVTSGKIEGAHGSATDFLQCTEIARFENPDAFSEAVSPTLRDSMWSEEWNESTANGYDALMYPGFMQGWEAQGGKNYWEDGAILDKSRSLAMFIPWWRNTMTKILPLPAASMYEKLLTDLDDYEKWLLHECLLPLWTAPRPRGRGAETRYALKRSLEQIYWRRCVLPSHYMSGGVHLIHPGQSAYHSIQLFLRMEPATVKEAFGSSASANVLAPENISYLSSTVQKPSMRGIVRTDLTLDESGAFTVQDEKSKNHWRIGASFWGNPSEWSPDIWCSIDFAEGRATVSEREFSFDRDPHHAIWFDKNTRKQIAEYVSQRVVHEAAMEIFLINMYIKRFVKNEPYLIWEAYNGKPFQQILLDHGYPLDRIFFRTINDGGVVRRDIKTMGIILGRDRNAKIERVDYGREAIAARRWVNHSDIIAREASWFEEKADRQYEAKYKGKENYGEMSKDDGLICLLQLGYVEAILPPNSYTSPDNYEPEDEVDLERLFGDMSVSERLGHEEALLRYALGTHDRPVESGFERLDGRGFEMLEGDEYIDSETGEATRPLIHFQGVA